MIDMLKGHKSTVYCVDYATDGKNMGSIEVYHHTRQPTPMPTRSHGLPHAFLSLHSLYSFLKNVLSWIDSSTSQLSVYNVCFIWSQTSRRPKHLFAKQAFGRVFADSITRVFKNGAGGKPEYSVFFGNYRNIPFCVRKLYKTQGKKLKNEVDSNMGW